MTRTLLSLSCFGALQASASSQTLTAEFLGAPPGASSIAFDPVLSGSAVVANAVGPSGASVLRWTRGSGYEVIPFDLGFGVGSVRGCSSDGQYITGTAPTQTGVATAVVWSAAAGAVDLGAGEGSSAFAVSPDGEVVLGTLGYPTWPFTGPRSFVWESGSLQELGDGNNLTYGASDASASVGTWFVQDSLSGEWSMQAVRWTPQAGVQRFGPLISGDAQTHGQAGITGTCIAPGGGVVGGVQSTTDGIYTAIRWSAQSGYSVISDAPWTGSLFIDISDDGSTLVGEVHETVGHDIRVRACRWTSAQGLESFTVPGDVHALVADVSETGATTVGRLLLPDGTTQGFAWAGSSVLVLEGLPGRNARAVAVSDNGRHILGVAENHSGTDQLVFWEARGGQVVIGSRSVPMASVRISVAPAGTEDWHSPGATSSVADFCGEEGGSGTRTEATGEFFWPFDMPAGEYRVRAEMCFQDPATGADIPLHQYPEGDPSRTWWVGPGHPPLPTIRFPSPVLLQCGFLDGQTGLAAYESFLRKDPADDPTKSAKRIPAFLTSAMPNMTEDPEFGYLNKGRSTKEHTENAKGLGELASRVRQTLIEGGYVAPEQAPDVTFSLLGHSMGGIIVRGLARHEYGGLVVDRVVTLDTPHGGTRIANVSIPLVNLWLPPTPGMSYEAMNGTAAGFGVAPYKEGWNHVNAVHSPSTWLMYSCSCDFIVLPAESAYGYGEPVNELIGYGGNGYPQTFCAGHKRSVELGHSNLSPALHCDNIKTDPPVIHDVAEFLASGKAPPSRQQPSSNPWSLGSSVLSTQVQGVLVAGAGTAETEALIAEPGAEVLGVVVLSGLGATYEITSQGVPVSVQDLSRSTFGPDGYQESFRVTGLTSSNLEITLTAAAETASARFSFLMPGSLAAEAAVSPSIAGAGSPLQLTSHLVDASGGLLLPLQGSSWAVITDSDGVETQVDLLDDGAHGDGSAGDGIFGASITAPAEAGRYTLEIQLQGEVGGTAIQRTTWRHFAVAPTSASLMGSLSESIQDADGDGLIDSLHFSTSVAYSQGGTYTLAADVEAADGTPLGTVQSSLELVDAPSTLGCELVLPGEDLVRWGEDGPWVLTGIRLVSLDEGALTADSLPDHQSMSYPLGSFEAPAGPLITQLLPQSGPVGGANVIQLYGANLADVGEVRIGGKAAQHQAVGDSAILITVPSAPPPPLGGSASGASPLLGGGAPSGIGSAGPGGLPGTQGTTRAPDSAAPSVGQTVDVEIITPWGSATLAGGYHFLE